LTLLLLLRLTLVPILIAAVTLASRRWGPRVGGFVTALPAVAGPTLGFYAVQQGNLFAADAARGTLLGLAGVAAFCLAYARASTRLHWAPCLIVGWGSFAVVTTLIYREDVGPLVALSIAVAALLAARALLPPPQRPAGPKGPALQPVAHAAGAPRWDLPLRMLAAAALVFILTSAANRLGSSVSGILTPFPVAQRRERGHRARRRGHGNVARTSYIPPTFRHLERQDLRRTAFFDDHHFPHR
jgi:hypothetical protein